MGGCRWQIRGLALGLLAGPVAGRALPEAIGDRIFDGLKISKEDQLRYRFLAGKEKKDALQGKVADASGSLKDICQGLVDHVVSLSTLKEFLGDLAGMSSDLKKAPETENHLKKCAEELFYPEYVGYGPRSNDDEVTYVVKFACHPFDPSKSALPAKSKAGQYVLKKMREVVSDDSLLKNLFDGIVEDFTKYQNRQTRESRLDLLLNLMPADSLEGLLNSIAETPQNLLKYARYLKRWQETGPADKKQALLPFVTKVEHAEAERESRWRKRNEAAQALLSQTTYEGDSVEDIKELLKVFRENSENKDQKIESYDHYTPLHLASMEDAPACVAFFLQNGAAVDAKTEDRYTALRLAVQRDRGRVIEVLLRHGAVSHGDDNFFRENYRYEPFADAFKHGKENAMEAFRKYWANPQIQAASETGMKTEMTPAEAKELLFQEDTYMGDPVEKINMLLKVVGDANIIRGGGYSPLHSASRADAPKCAEALLQHGADVNARDSVGETPMLPAARFNHVGIVDVLLRYGGDPNAEPNDNVITPKLRAWKRQHFDLWSLIKKYEKYAGDQNRLKLDVLKALQDRNVRVQKNGDGSFTVRPDQSRWSDFTWTKE